MAWLEAVWFVRRRMRLQINASVLFQRCLACHVFGIVVGGLLYLTGIGAMNSVLLTMATLGILLLCIRREFWPMAVSGALVSTVLYTLVLKAALTIWPPLITAWTEVNLWGLGFWGMPLEEIVWAFLYCPVWGLSTAYMFDARLE